jgi:carboxymethylenebutenolidase
MSTSITLGNTPGYLATPPGNGPWPGLIVIQEWWGLDAQTKSIADRFAAAGYLSFAPDLYHGERAQLGDGKTAMTLVQKYAPGAAAELQGAYDALKVHPQCSGKVGSVGFCFGGHMSLLLGISRPLDALCTFYGGGMQQSFDKLGALKSPVLGLFGDQDQSIPVGTIEEFDRLLDTVGVEHEVITYPNAGHAFFRDSDPNAYRPVAAEDAWKRVNAFLEKNLR